MRGPRSRSRPLARLPEERVRLGRLGAPEVLSGGRTGRRTSCGERGSLGEFQLRGPADRPVGNLWAAAARAGALIAPCSPRGSASGSGCGPRAGRGERQRLPGKGRGSAGGGGTPGPRRQPCRPTQRATGSRACRTPRAAGALVLPLRPPLRSRPPKVQNILQSVPCPAG